MCLVRHRQGPRHPHHLVRISSVAAMNATHATSSPPSRLVVRWVSAEQARHHVEYNQIRASWKHFVPELGRTRVGVCFDLLTTANWRDGTKQVGIAIDTASLPPTAQRFEFDGHKVFCLSERLAWEFDHAKRLTLMREARKHHDLYTRFPDELFVTGTIDALGERMSGIVLMNAGRKLGPKCDSEIRDFCNRHGKPVLELTPQEFSDARNTTCGLAELLATWRTHDADQERMRV